jgi:hypothetical protein
MVRGTRIFAVVGPFPPFRKVAEIDILVQLMHVSEAFVEELLHAALVNSKLKILHLCMIAGKDCTDWGPQMGTILRGLRDHPGLRTYYDDVEAFGPDFKHRRELLSNNRVITMTNTSEQVCTEQTLCSLQLLSYFGESRGQSSRSAHL